MTRAATGYPFTGHKSLAELWGLAEPAPKPLTRDEAEWRVKWHCRCAARALEAGCIILWGAHTSSADKLAADYKVAWEDPARVRCPLAERRS